MIVFKTNLYVILLTKRAKNHVTMQSFWTKWKNTFQNK